MNLNERKPKRAFAFVNKRGLGSTQFVLVCLTRYTNTQMHNQ